ncbi:MAG: hypothetical protein V4723_03130 [Pseudomonadota bacterium]
MRKPDPQLLAAAKGLMNLPPSLRAKLLTEQDAKRLALRDTQRTTAELPDGETMERTLEQQAQQWLVKRQEELASRREAEKELGHVQWRSTAETNPNLLPEPLKSAARQLLGLPAVELLPSDEVELLREHFKESAAKIDRLLEK